MECTIYKITILLTMGKWWLSGEHFSKNQYTMHAPHQSEFNELEPESSFSIIIHIWKEPQNNIETFLVLFLCSFVCVLGYNYYHTSRDNSIAVASRSVSCRLFILLSLYSLIFDSLSFYHSSTRLWC